MAVAIKKRKPKSGKKVAPITDIGDESKLADGELYTRAGERVGSWAIVGKPVCVGSHGKHRMVDGVSLELLVRSLTSVSHYSLVLAGSERVGKPKESSRHRDCDDVKPFGSRCGYVGPVGGDTRLGVGRLPRLD